MPRIRLLPENNARRGFADAREVAAIRRRLPRDRAPVLQHLEDFRAGWRSPVISRIGQALDTLSAS
jgi:hypothetical protein